MAVLHCCRQRTQPAWSDGCVQLASDRVAKESNVLAERVAKAHRDMEEQVAANTALLAETSQKRLELRAKEDDIAHLQARDSAPLVFCPVFQPDPCSHPLLGWRLDPLTAHLQITACANPAEC